MVYVVAAVVHGESGGGGLRRCLTVSDEYVSSALEQCEININGGTRNANGASAGDR